MEPVPARGFADLISERRTNQFGSAGIPDEGLRYGRSMKTKNQQARDKVDEALLALGHTQVRCISNKRAARILGLIPWDVKKPCIPAARMLRQWAFPTCETKLDVWKDKIIAQYEADKISAPKNKKKRSKHETPAIVVYSKKENADVIGDGFLRTYKWRRLRMQALKLYGARC